MGMRKFKLSALASTILLMGSGGAFAASDDVAPPSFTNWWSLVGNANGTTQIQGAGGNGAVACAAGFDCSTVAAGDGFIQLMMTPTGTTDPNPTSYIATIVSDDDVGNGEVAQPGSLNFVDISYVKMKLNLGIVNEGNESGITAFQKINDIGSGGPSDVPFTSVTWINSGWADPSGNGGSAITIDQSLFTEGVDSAAIGDNFESRFLYQANSNAAGTRTGLTMEIDQVIGLFQNDAGALTDVQSFTLREIAGDMLTSADQIAFGSDTVDWAEGDRIKSTWLGQEVDMGNSGFLGATFGYSAFENLTPGKEALISRFGLTATDAAGPTVWNDVFNLTFADPEGGAIDYFSSFTPCRMAPDGDAQLIGPANPALGFEAGPACD